MSPEDKALAKLARSTIARSSLDISELMIACSRGIIELSGKVKPPRGMQGAYNSRKEFEILKTQLRSTRGVKEVYGDRVAIFEQ